MKDARLKKKVQRVFRKNTSCFKKTHIVFGGVKTVASLKKRDAIFFVKKIAYYFVASLNPIGRFYDPRSHLFIKKSVPLVQTLRDLSKQFDGNVE